MRASLTKHVEVACEAYRLQLVRGGTSSSGSADDPPEATSTGKRVATKRPRQPLTIDDIATMKEEMAAVHASVAELTESGVKTRGAAAPSTSPNVAAAVNKAVTAAQKAHAAEIKTLQVSTTTHPMSHSLFVVTPIGTCGQLILFLLGTPWYCLVLLGTPWYLLQPYVYLRSCSFKRRR
jgi:hypothetical protein